MNSIASIEINHDAGNSSRERLERICQAFEDLTWPEMRAFADHLCAVMTAGQPAAVTLTSVSNAAANDFAEWLRDRKNSRKVPHRMEECGYVPVRNGSAKDGLWPINGRRQVVYARRTPAESVLHYLGSKASLYSGVMHWNQYLKEIAAYMAQNRMARAMKGELSQTDQRFLQRLKINSVNWARIKEQMQAHGSWTDGIYDPGTEHWPAGIRDIYAAAIRAEADTVIVTPGIGDKVPLVEELWWLKPAQQFKSFALASHRKTMMVGLQEDQGRFIANALLAVSMGMFVYWLKSFSREGQTLSDNPGTWLAEGVDRAGVFPIVMELNNMWEGAGGPGIYYGLGSMLGEAPQRASRYSQRGAAEAVLGPTAGLVNDARIGDDPLPWRRDERGRGQRQAAGAVRQPSGGQAAAQSVAGARGERGSQVMKLVLTVSLQFLGNRGIVIG